MKNAVVCSKRNIPPFILDHPPRRTGDDSLLALLADGAGGTSGGRESATWALDELERRLKSVRIGREPLHHVMSELAVEAQERSAGQTTLIVVQLTGTRLVGASIGDSEVRLFDPTSCQTLTDGQQRKPLLGGGIPPHPQLRG